MKSLTALSPTLRHSLIALFVAGLLFWSSLGALLPTLPLYVQEIGGTSQQVGIVIGSFAVGLLLSRAWLGRLADRRSRKIVLLIGMAVVAIAPLGYLLVNSIILLTIIRAFHGISIAAFATGYLALVVDLSPAQNRGEIIGYMSLVNPIGIAFGPAVGGFIQASLGYFALFLFSSALGLLGLFCTLRLEEASSLQDSSQAKKRLTEKDDRFWSLLLLPHIRVPTAVMLLVGLAFGTLSAFVSLFIKDTGVDLNIGWFYSVAAIASFAVRLMVGRASDRFGRGLFITISLILYSFAMLSLARAQEARDFLLAGTLEGMGFGLLVPMIAAMMADRSQASERGRVFGLCMGGFDLGIAIAGPIAGTIADWLDYRITFSIAAGMVFLALIVFATAGSRDFSHSLRYALGRGRDSYAVE